MNTFGEHITYACLMKRFENPNHNIYATICQLYSKYMYILLINYTKKNITIENSIYFPIKDILMYKKLVQ